MSDADTPGAYFSSPCMAHDVDPAYADPSQIAAGQPFDVALWRREARARLRADRAALGVAERQQAGQALAGHLRSLIGDRFDGARGRVISGYWPIKGEPDLRDLMAEWHASGVLVALPVVEVRAAPLVFRRWTPDMTLQRGDWNIPVPPPDAERVTPEITLAPMIGWTAQGYRLGYGGGYFDRTLAVLDPRPVSIGIALASARLETIHPQPHDIPLDMVMTETGLTFE